MGETFLKFLNEERDDKPFCLSVSFSAPHGSISGSMIPGQRGDKRMTKAAHQTALFKNHPNYGNLYRDVISNCPKKPDWMLSA